MVQLFYLSAGACPGHRGVRYACTRLCTGVPEPCLLGDSAEVPFVGWVGGTGRWEGAWRGHWGAGEQEDLCWG